MAETTATIYVYYSTNMFGAKVLQCFPNDEIFVPPDATATLIWQAVASPSGKPVPAFLKNSILPSAGTKDKITITVPNTPTEFVYSFVTTVDNSAATLGRPVDVSLKFTATDQPGLHPPPTTDGGGSIRNKGTSLFPRAQIRIALAALVVGVMAGVAMHKIFGP
ncbi:MAG TPA: hypothetical protein VH375_09740 [Rhodanobacteraceae bacterium]|jgi:hypothetical protein